MKIAIVGAGNVGGALARAAAGAGHEATLSAVDRQEASRAERLAGVMVHSRPSEGGTPRDAFIAADGPVAKAKVGEFARSLGYRVIDAGGLRMARSLEDMALLNIALNVRDGLPWQSAWKLLGPTGETS